MPVNWEKLLLAWMHDPVDKALDIRFHEQRSRSYLTTAMGRDVSRNEFAGLHDELASGFERLPMPTAGEDAERAVGPKGGKILVCHPMSAEQYGLVAELDEESVRKHIAEIVSGLEAPQTRFLALWRLLPDHLAQVQPHYPRLPADTRCPDHTIIQHMDIAAGLARALEGGRGATAFLSFKLSPVQAFIQAARSTRDLLSSSYILSWLAFSGIAPVLRECGPSALIYPALRAVPLLDRWLVEDCGLAGKLRSPYDPELHPRLLTPCLPNRFLAVVPWGPEGSEARELAAEVESSCRRCWTALCERVRAHLDPHWKDLDPHWARFWDAQVCSFFDVRTSVLALRDCSEEIIRSLFGEAVFNGVVRVRKLQESIPPGDRYTFAAVPAGQWQLALNTSAALMDAQTALRNIPDYKVQAPVPQKCTLMGTYEQMGPPALEDSNEFWKAARQQIPGMLREGERLCAVSLAKRFAFAAYLGEQLRMGASDVRFPDTATIAARPWLDALRKRTGVAIEQRDDWDGEWLHRPEKQAEGLDPVPNDIWEILREAFQFGRPPTYYGILVMDGDEIGKWLSGENSPRVRQVLHPKIEHYYSELPGTAEGLDARRPVGPALHAGISEALSNYALQIVPYIVSKYRGALVYAGGDDLLALLSAPSALPCARELRLAFSGCPEGAANNGADSGYYRVNGRDLLTMGSKASASAGLAVAHYKDDLRTALEAAREAEELAKREGRNRLGLCVLRRSGEHTMAACQWSGVVELEQQSRLYAKGASDRWVYHLRREQEAIQSLPPEAILGEVRRIVARSESDPRPDLDSITRLWGICQPDLARFLVLCQSAAFLARGREP